MKTIFFLIFFTYSAYSQHIIHDASQPTTIDVSGRDGSSGRNGSDGRNATCDSDGNVESRGDDGEDGGNGEDGTSGKNIVLHYNDLQELKNLTLISQGGNGGKGGRPGEGGWGCGGIYLGSGDDGRHGRDGSNGSPGSLYLVKKPLNYIYPVKDITSPLSKLTNAGVTLKDNVWSTHKYAENLLEQSSRLASTYYMLEDQVEKKVSISWQVGRDIERYKDQIVELHLSGKAVSVSFPGAQVDYKITEQGPHTVITIYSIYLNHELFNLETNFEGKGLKFALNLKNKSNLIDLSQLKGRISIAAHGFFSSNTRYNIHHGDISEFTTIHGQDMIIRIGKMPFSRWHKRKGQKLNIILNFSYEYNGQEISHKLNLSHKI